MEASTAPTVHITAYRRPQRSRPTTRLSCSSCPGSAWMAQTNFYCWTNLWSQRLEPSLARVAITTYGNCLFQSNCVGGRFEEIIMELKTLFAALKLQGSLDVLTGTVAFF